MGLPSRNLDDRTFQDIVDEAKKRIAASCPAWTDHNVSDPGITLVELLAWMTEMILYRLNQVPEKHYIKLMELLGLKLREPEPARTEVTFYLSAPQAQSITIREGTEVATVRTEARASVIFSTDEDLVVQPPELCALMTREGSGEGANEQLRAHNLQHLGVSGFEFEAFGARPRVGNALYFGFVNDLSHHVIGIEVTCPTATGLGIDPGNPPWMWEGWHGGEGDRRWLPAAVETDGTGGMNQAGIIFLRLPGLALREFSGQRAYWVRCRLVEPASSGTGYDQSPRLQNIVVRSWGGSVWATHASVVRGEVLGRSDGSPGQRFGLEHYPLLRRRRGETVEVRAPGEESWEPWIERPDLADSGPFDKHYTCDSATGEIRFGPALRQPDGSAHAYGAIPPRGALIRFSSYRYGGGVVGNVQAGTLTALKTSIPYVDRVTNHADATGGIDAETVEMAEMRAPQLLRSRGRAVTASDYEALARMADSRVERARCIQPVGDRDPALAGRVYLLLVPKVNRPEERIVPEQLAISDDLRQSVQRYVDEYRLLSVRLDIREPQYHWVAVEVSAVVAPDADPERVRAEAEARLYRFLNPIVGGQAGNGWPFGRDLYPSD
ncbi:MAG: putative baseplate assembly protein, partial [Anaerolineae bacterium]|nr:putative baseplate assembly protein [Anaerolineae bacterium]